MELILKLADSDGVFLETSPVYRPCSEQGVASQEALEALDATRHDLEETQAELRTARSSMEEQASHINDLQTELETYVAGGVSAELQKLKEDCQAEKEKNRQTWKVHCEHIAEQDVLVSAKDDEIASLKRQLAELRTQQRGDRGRRSQSGVDSRSPSRLRSTETSQSPVSGVGESLSEQRNVADHLLEPSPEGRSSGVPRPRRGKAPPVDQFTGENVEVQLEDWLPALERAAAWNGWSQSDRLLQLAGHLRGRALQEWNLLDLTDKTSFTPAVEALRLRLDPGSKAVAAQDFRHAAQGDEEQVADFIRRLEKTFRIAYCRDKLSDETRDALLYGQLQESLCFDLVRAPAVSGAQSYKELCVAAKSEERRQAALKQRKQYHLPKQVIGTPSIASRPHRTNPPQLPAQEDTASKRPPSTETRTCYKCGRRGHLASACRQPRSESGGSTLRAGGSTKQVQVEKAMQGQPTLSQEPETPLELLFSSSEEEEAGVRVVHVKDQGSFPQCAKVQIQGVPVYGVLDSGADISIMGGNLFRKVAAAARLKKKDFKKADKVPRTYDQKPFTLDGRMDLDVSFDGKTMHTPVYIKMNAHEQLLLSEGVCRQLGLISYHGEVERWKNVRKQAPRLGDSRAPALPLATVGAQVPTVRVRLVQTVNLLPHQGKMVQVRADPGFSEEGHMLLEPTPHGSGVQVDMAILQPTKEGTALVLIFNPMGCSCHLEQGSTVGDVSSAALVEPSVDPGEAQPQPVTEVRQIQSETVVTWRRKRLAELVGESELLDKTQQERLLEFLGSCHDVFSLEDQERGETDLVEMRILTGDAAPKKLPARRMPFVVRQEVARQLKLMQDAGVIRPPPARGQVRWLWSERRTGAIGSV